MLVLSGAFIRARFANYIKPKEQLERELQKINVNHSNNMKKNERKQSAVAPLKKNNRNYMARATPSWLTKPKKCSEKTEEHTKINIRV